MDVPTLIVTETGKRKLSELTVEGEMRGSTSTSDLTTLDRPSPPPSPPKKHHHSSQTQSRSSSQSNTHIISQSHSRPTRPKTSQAIPLKTLHCCDEKKKNWDGSPKIPYPVIYKCSLCTRKYYCIVQDNPWFTIQQHTCPFCKEKQFPVLDIGMPQNARELDPNMKLLYHEVFDEEFLDLSKAGSIPLFLDDAVLVALFPSEPSIQRACENKLPKELFEEQGKVNFRLLALILHTKSCDNLHGSSKEHELCYHVKVLLLHMQQCSCKSCTFPYCQEGKKVLYYLSFFPQLPV